MSFFFKETERVNMGQKYLVLTVVIDNCQTLSLKKHDNACPANSTCEGQIKAYVGKGKISHWSPTHDNCCRKKLLELVLLMMSMRTICSCNLDGEGVIKNDTSKDGRTYKIKSLLHQIFTAVNGTNQQTEKNHGYQNRRIP